MTTEKKQIRTNPDTGFPDWGEGHCHGWDWERNCPIPEAERTLTNLLLGALHAYRHGDKGTAGRILFTPIGFQYAWELLRDGITRLAGDLKPEATEEPTQPAQPPAEENVGGKPPEETSYPASPYDVRDEVERKCSELGDRPVKWEMKATDKKPARMAWVWAVGDWRAVEILGGGKRRARWLDALPSFVPAHAKGLHPDHSRQEQEREVEKEDAAERAAIQAAQQMGEDLEKQIGQAEAKPAPPKAKPRPTNGSLPGAEWLLRFDSTEPIAGKARKSKSPLGCELCLRPVEPTDEDWTKEFYTSSKTSAKRAHRQCFDIRKAKLANERNAP